MFLPFGLARGSAQSRGSPGNPAGPLARDRLVQDAVASEDVHTDKGARLVHDLVRGRRVDLERTCLGPWPVIRSSLSRTRTRSPIGQNCAPELRAMGPLGEASVVELVGRHRYQ
jgi:hypothetical protein